MASGDARKARKALKAEKERKASKDKSKAAPRSLKQKIFLVALVLAAFLFAVALHFYVFKYPKLLQARMEAYESAAIAACKTFAEAQDVYRRTDWDSDGVLEYATSIDGIGANSLAGKDIGFGGQSLIDAAFVAAVGDPGNAQPRAGYVFKVLTGQGATAPGGAKSFVDPDGNATQGYALVACPAKYGVSGTQSFIVNNNGMVLEKDLGPETHAAYRAMTEYNPDETWTIAE